MKIVQVDLTGRESKLSVYRWMFAIWLIFYRPVLYYFSVFVLVFIWRLVRLSLHRQGGWHYRGVSRRPLSLCVSTALALRSGGAYLSTERGKRGQATNPVSVLLNSGCPQPRWSGWAALPERGACPWGEPGHCGWVRQSAARQATLATTYHRRFHGHGLNRHFVSPTQRLLAHHIHSDSEFLVLWAVNLPNLPA